MLNEQLLTMFMMLYHQTIITTLSMLFGIIYIFPFYICGFRLYVVYSNNIQKLLLSRIKWSTNKDENNSPVGYFMGNYCVGHFNEKENILKIICTEKIFAQLTKKNQIETENNDLIIQEYIKVFYKNNGIRFVYYNSRLFNVTNFNMLPNQKYAVDKIIETYNSSVNNSIVCILHGKPNTGKSMISILTAKELKANYCKCYKPIDPGDSFENIYNTCNPTKENPLVILLDEFDIILNKIHNEMIKTNPEVLTEVTDKISWNQLFDNISIGFYPFTIIIMTSNLRPKKIKKLYDPSYIRENRCHLTIEIK